MISCRDQARFRMAMGRHRKSSATPPRRMNTRPPVERIDLVGKCSSEAGRASAVAPGLADRYNRAANPFQTFGPRP
jgi:hypothetical protein